jgi:hypothetical protein
MALQLTALLNPGGGTLKSTSVEAAILELATRYQIAETTGNVTPNQIALNLSTGNNVAIINTVIPITITPDNGSINIVAVSNSFPSLPGYAVDPLSGLTTSSVAGNLLELFQTLQSKERAQTVPNDEVQIVYNADALTATVTCNILFNLAIAPDGDIAIEARAYIDVP